MPRGMSEDVSNVIVQALNKGLSRRQIAGVVGVSPRAITRISTNLKKHGTPKAPPRGAKLGRPNKLTKPQAEAIVSWMAERNHTFYVKDLVAFLRDAYEYRGCNGTVRRSLVRAGYRRKLPWHKSEITTWTPPDHEPAFITVDDTPELVRGLENHHVDDDEAEDEDPIGQDHGDEMRPDIDPALQDQGPASASPDSGALRNHVQQQFGPDQYDPLIIHHKQQHIIPSSTYSSRGMGPKLSHATSSPQPSLHPPFTYQHNRNARNQDLLAGVSQAADGGIMPSARLDLQENNQDQPQISTLQSQIAQQQALIDSLQQQLAQHTR